MPMKRIRRRGPAMCRPDVLCAAALLAHLNAAAAADAGAAPVVTALHCGHLIDTVAGKVLGATTIVTEGSRVREVVPGTAAAPGAQEIDLSTQTCMPGLIDSHTHLTSETSRTAYIDQFHWHVADYAVRSTPSRTSAR